MTFKDIFGTPDNFTKFVKSHYNRVAMSPNDKYAIYLCNYLGNDWITPLRCDSEHFEPMMSRWIMKALDYQNDFEKYVSAIKLSDDSDRIIERKVNEYTSKQTNTSTTNDINENADNPSTDTTPFDLVPFTTVQNRSQSDNTNEDTTDSQNINTTEYGDISFTQELISVNSPQLMNIFNMNLRYIFAATY